VSNNKKPKIIENHSVIQTETLRTRANNATIITTDNSIDKSSLGTGYTSRIDGNYDGVLSHNTRSRLTDGSSGMTETISLAKMEPKSASVESKQKITQQAVSNKVTVPVLSTSSDGIAIINDKQWTSIGIITYIYILYYWTI